MPTSIPCSWFILWICLHIGLGPRLNQKHILKIVWPFDLEKRVGGERSNEWEGNAETNHQHLSHSKKTQVKLLENLLTFYLVDVMWFDWSKIIKPDEVKSIMKPAVKPSTMYCWLSCNDKIRYISFNSISMKIQQRKPWKNLRTLI